MSRPDPDRTRMDLNPADPPPAGGPAYVEHPADRPPAGAPAYVDQAGVEQQEEVVDPDQRRRRTVRIVCTVINVICGVFAVVLALHIILVIGSANQGNGFAQLINDWSGAVSLGLRDLFTPANIGMRTFLNDGLAAIAWLVIAALLTYLIRKFALPVPRRVAHYRRTWR
jgi:hypothetical protein